jgi:uncharacterized membrane protein YfcA
MKKEFLFSVGRFLIKILITEVVILIITAIICWFVGWRTFSEFGQGLIYAGIAVLFFSASSIFGATRLAKDPTVRYIQSVSADDAHTRSKRHMQDLTESRAFLILVGIVGIITVALGTWLNSFK